MSPVRDFFLERGSAASIDDQETRPRRRVRHRARTDPGQVAATTLGVLAGSRDLAPVACSAGLVVGARAPAVLVGLHDVGDPQPALRTPGRGDAGRLAGSLAARGLQADARGRLVVVTLCDDPGEAASTWSRAQAAAGPAPSVLALATRHDELDVLLEAQDALLIALAPSAPASLATLALAGVEGLARSAAVVSGRIDPVSRALATAGLWPAGSVRSAVQGALGLTCSGRS